MLKMPKSLFVLLLGAGLFTSACTSRKAVVQNTQPAVAVPMENVSDAPVTVSAPDAEIAPSNISNPETVPVAAAPEKNESRQQAAAEELTWYSFNEGLKKAQEEGKILLVDSYTDWCYWCKVMDKNTYTNAEIISMLNKDFVLVKFNMEVNGMYEVAGKKMDNTELYYWLGNGQGTGFPTTMFMTDLSGATPRSVYSGYYPPEEFKKALTTISAARAK